MHNTQQSQVVVQTSVHDKTTIKTM